jgi:ligand-binding sensor domain-containing protein/signal transduction histidine kinase
MVYSADAAERRHVPGQKHLLSHTAVVPCGLHPLGIWHHLLYFLPAMVSGPDSHPGDSLTMQRIRRRALLYCAFLIVLPPVTHTQILPFEYYTMNDGLVSNYVTALLQDTRGYLWIGTNEGLCVYDGSQFKSYTARNGLPSGIVSDICESATIPGAIWVALNTGILCRVVDGGITTFPLETQDGRAGAGSIVEDSSGALWCGSDNGLFIFKNGVYSPVLRASGAGMMSNIVRSPDGRLWFFYGPDLYRCMSGQVVRAGLTLELRRGEIYSALFADPDGTLWCSTTAGRIFHIQNLQLAGEWTFPEEVTSFIDDRRGSLWIGSVGGLHKVSKGGDLLSNRVTYTTKNGLPSNQIYAGLIDREGNLWFGSAIKGLFKLSERCLLRFPLDGLETSLSNSVAIDSLDHIWIPSALGLWEMWLGANGSWQSYMHRTEELRSPGNAVICVVDGAEGLWISCSGGALQRYRFRRKNEKPTELQLVTVVKPLRDFPKATPLCLLLDSKGRLWYSLDRVGVAVIDPKAGGRLVSLLTQAEGLPDNNIRALYQDREGAMWFGGWQSGLGMLRESDPKNVHVHTLTIADGLPDNHIRVLFQDRNGVLWIGTRYGGLALLDHGSLRTLSRREGLLSDGVWAISGDWRGGVWLGTNMGLEQSSDSAPGAFLPNGHLVGSGIYSCVITRTNQVAGFTREGVLIYEPGQEVRDTIPPPIYITRLQVNGTDYPVVAETNLSYRQNTLRIEYVGISLRHERGVRYRYRLQGLDMDWQFPVAERAITYGALKPGRYVFQVSAMNDDGTSSVQPAALTWVISPPYWQQWWFVVSVLAVLGLGVWGAYLYRVNQLLKIERLRTHIASDLHDDIGSGLTRIAILSDVARQKVAGLDASGSILTVRSPFRTGQTSAEESIGKVGQIARELVDAMSDVVWTVDPKHENARHLVQRIKAYAVELCEAKQITISFQIDPAVEDLPLGPEPLRAVLLIAKEALTNIVRHSGCTKVSITIAGDRRSVTVRIADNGKGFDASQPASGNGLVNMQLRAERAGGTMRIRTAPENGTAIEVAFPRS